MPHRPTPALIVLAVAAALAGCDDTAAGRRLYAAGRFPEALAAFDEADRGAGDDASAELLYDEALAALRTGDLTKAESAAKRAAERGGAEFAALRDFLLGNVAFARAAFSEAQAAGPEAEPFVFDIAIAQAVAARDAWQLAGKSRADWPEARRNVERARIAIERLQRKKAEAEARRNQPKPLPLPRKADPPPDAKKDSEEAALSELQKDDLPPGEVLRLLDALAAREKEKLEVRRARRREKSAEVERDW